MPTRLLTVAGLLWLGLLAVARWGDWLHAWPLELLDIFALYAFAPFPLLGLAALLTRSRALLGLTLAAALLFAQQFGHLLLPPPASAAPREPGLRLLTANVLGTNRDAAPLVELIRREQPDLVLLQEFTAPFAADLEKRLGEDYPFRILTPTRATNDGSGTFSRHPLVEGQPFRLTDDGNIFQHVRLDAGGRAVSVFNVHLVVPRFRTSNPPGPIPPLVRGFGTPAGESELDWLIAQTAELAEPYVLAGDFNIAAGSRPYRCFPAHWRDAFAECGWGFGHTFPTHYDALGLTITQPLLRIDYVLSSPEIAPLGARVLYSVGSDHLPVVADLQLPPR